MQFSQIGWVKVRLPGRKEDLTMVVARTPGRDVPFMVLTSLAVESAEDARRVAERQQWICTRLARSFSTKLKTLSTTRHAEGGCKRAQSLHLNEGPGDPIVEIGPP